MTKQPEHILEENLIKQLSGGGYERVSITDEAELLANLKTCLERHNNTSFTDKEFAKILNHLSKGNVFEKAKILRDKMQLTKEDGTSVYIEFLNQKQWAKNHFQVTNQVTMVGNYKNRYDVTLLVNGLPLVQMELKRRGLEMKEAFNQIMRYIRHSYSAGKGLFQYVQLYVISNGVNTKYFANNRLLALNYKQTFFWSDSDNKKITQLSDFASTFLECSHLHKMISNYIVLAETDKILMVLRPYQYYATENIIGRVKNTDLNGYIWHTTGSGKTLTSFKASQILMDLPDVHKVVFVVDRRDLDYQTTKEFNSFSDGSVDGTDNTKALVNQFGDDTKLLVTTIQKLNNAISGQRYASVMEKLKDKRIVFIFDECHRSQFGETHTRIKKFFSNHQMFGFTGTPIFAENAIKNIHGKRTTKELFGDCLHKYVITDAIRDENVLKFSVEYVGRYKKKNSSLNFMDIEVEDIDTKELYDSPDRLNKITDYIIHNHKKKTHNKAFTGMFCVSSVDNLISYYELFKSKKEEGVHDLKVATIFSYNANEDDRGAKGITTFDDEIPMDDSESSYENKHSRDKLEGFIGDYNEMFGTKFSTKDSQSYYNYYNNIAKRVKNKEIDILLVVNMFLTGFDSKPLNTLYVDKNLKYHGLIQSYSRTNRILDEKKSQGNIVVFRNLKQKTDDAITLFSNKEAIEEILMQPYEDYIYLFNEAIKKLFTITPTVDSVNDLEDDVAKLNFVTAFRDVMRIHNVLVTFADFNFDDLYVTHQTYEDYKSKYLDIKDSTKSDGEKDSILDDVDFELELIHRDEINVTYILNLLKGLKSDLTIDGQASKRKQIMDVLGGEAQLRSKRELIERFIDENLPLIKDSDDIPEAFDEYWDSEQKKAFTKICEEVQAEHDKLEKIVGDYLFTQQSIQRDDVIESLLVKPKILERKPIANGVIDKIYNFVETFVNGIAA
jgi:type I restriction enzyme, R subunit